MCNVWEDHKTQISAIESGSLASNTPNNTKIAAISSTDDKISTNKPK